MRPAWADFDLMTLPAARTPRRWPPPSAARPSVEYAQAALSQSRDVSAERPALLPAVELARDRHGAGLGHPARRDERRDRRRARQRRGLPQRAHALHHAARSGSRPAGRCYPSLGAIDVPFAAATDLGDADAVRGPRDFIWDDDLPLDLDGHGTHVAGTIGQATNNGVGVAGMAFNVRIMPVKVISRRVGRHLRQPARRHRRRRRARHPLGRRQRRARHQHEHRPRTRRRGAGRRGGGALRGVARRVRGHRRGQRRQRAEPAESLGRVRRAHRRRGGGRRGRPRPESRLLLDHRQLRRDCRRRAATQRLSGG